MRDLGIFRFHGENRKTAVWYQKCLRKEGATSLWPAFAVAASRRQGGIAGLCAIRRTKFHSTNQSTKIPGPLNFSSPHWAVFGVLEKFAGHSTKTQIFSLNFFQIITWSSSMR